MLKIKCFCEIGVGREGVMFNCGEEIFTQEICRDDNGFFHAVGNVPVAESQVYLEDRLCILAGWRSDMDSSFRQKFCKRGAKMYENILPRVIDRLNTINDVEHEIEESKKMLTYLHALASELRRLGGKLFSRAKSELKKAGFYLTDYTKNYFTFHATNGADIIHVSAFDFLIVPDGKKRDYLVTEKILKIISQREQYFINKIQQDEALLKSDCWLRYINDILAAQEELKEARAKLSPSFLRIARKHFAELD